MTGFVALLLASGSKAFLIVWLIGLPWLLCDKESACQCRNRGFDPCVGKIPWRRKWQPSPVFLPEKSHEPRSLVGHSLQGHKSWIRLSNSTTATTNGIRSLGFLCFALKVFTCYFLSWSFQPFIIKKFQTYEEVKRILQWRPILLDLLNHISVYPESIYPSIHFILHISE